MEDIYKIQRQFLKNVIGLSWVQLLGMGIILCGIFLSVRSGKRYES